MVCPPNPATDGTWDMPAGSGPCRTWPIDTDCSCFPDPGVEPWCPQMRAAVETATEILWRLTAGRFGVCREIVRPCRRKCRTGHREGAVIRPQLLDGRWVNLSGCGCPCPEATCDPCGCGSGPDRIELPGPVVAPRLPADCEGDDLVTVWVDGIPLDADAVRVQAPNVLLRVDGFRFPQCQDLSAAYDAEGAFAVEYWRGTPVPSGGVMAVSKLACEIYKACVRDDSCALPARVRTVQREGITYDMVDSLELIGEGRTGLTEVDMWVSAVNPTGLRSPSIVVSPDQYRVKREATRIGGWGS